MKKTIVTIAAVVASIATFAQTHVTSKVSVENSSRESVYNLKYISDKASKVKVTIADTDGKTILEDEVYGKNFVRPYNFNELPKGAYNVTVNNVEGTTQLAINHNGTTVNPVRSVAVKPLDNDRFELTIIGNNAEEVTVMIYDNAGELVHSQLVAKKGSFTQVYDLAKVNASGYRVEVLAGNTLVSQVTL